MKKCISTSPKFLALLAEAEPDIQQGYKEAVSSTGRSKGWLKKVCPRVGSKGAAFWQAAVKTRNPYKISVIHHLWGKDQLIMACEDFLTSLPEDLWDSFEIDPDRAKLDSLGVY